jgi:hypothetical protein
MTWAKGGHGPGWASLSSAYALPAVLLGLDPICIAWRAPAFAVSPSARRRGTPRGIRRTSTDRTALGGRRWWRPRPLVIKFLRLCLLDGLIRWPARGSIETEPPPPLPVGSLASGSCPVSCLFVCVLFVFLF